MMTKVSPKSARMISHPVELGSGADRALEEMRDIVLALRADQARRVRLHAARIAHDVMPAAGAKRMNTRSASRSVNGAGGVRGDHRREALKVDRACRCRSRA